MEVHILVECLCSKELVELHNIEIKVLFMASQPLLVMFLQQVTQYKEILKYKFHFSTSVQQSLSIKTNESEMDEHLDLFLLIL